MQKIIITGPTGAIGHALLELCIANGVEVYALCRPTSSRKATLPTNKLVHIVDADLAALSGAAKVLPHDCTVFYHLGWAGTFGAERDDMYLQNKNVQFALDAVELAYACGCHTFVGAGSQAEYGRTTDKLCAMTPTFPENGYGIAKLCAGQMTRVQAHKYNMKHIWTRILSVYGPHDGANTMIMATIGALLRGEKPAFTEGEQMWDYLYAKDAGALLFALGGPQSVDGKIYCLGSGTAHPLKEYIEILRDEVGPDLPVGLGEIPYGPRQVMYLCADMTEVEQDLDYHAYYSFAEGIAETIKWYKLNVGK